MVSMIARHGDLHQGNRVGQGTRPWSSRGPESRHWLDLALEVRVPPILLIYISAPNGGPTTGVASSQCTQTGTQPQTPALIWFRYKCAHSNLYRVQGGNLHEPTMSQARGPAPQGRRHTWSPGGRTTRSSRRDAPPGSGLSPGQRAPPAAGSTHTASSGPATETGREPAVTKLQQEQCIKSRGQNPSQKPIC